MYIVHYMRWQDILYKNIIKLYSLTLLGNFGLGGNGALLAAPEKNEKRNRIDMGNTCILVCYEGVDLCYMRPRLPLHVLY